MGIPSLNEQEIRCQISQIGDLPPLPLALQRVLEIIQNEVASVEELESLIKYDQALLAKILRVANSSFYGFRGKINTISRAIVIIGFQQVRSICLCALLTDFFSNGTPIDSSQRERLWKHAFTTARLAAEIAQKRPWIGKEDAYVLGLLHDLGRVVMAAYLSEHYNVILKMATNRKAPLWYIETHYGLTHTRTGKWVALKWAFPEVFRRVMEFHHAPEKSPSFRAEAHLIALANILANSQEYPELLTDDFTLSYCSELYIPEEEWEGYQGRFGEIRHEVDELWNLLR